MDSPAGDSGGADLRRGTSGRISVHAAALILIFQLLLSRSTQAAQPAPPFPTNAAPKSDERDDTQTLASLEAGWDLVPQILKRIVPPEFPQREFMITDYGAEAGSENKCTDAFGKAIAACAEAGGGRVTVPEGKFLTGPIHLKSHVELHLGEGAEIIFSDDMDDYLPPVFVRVGGIEVYNYSPLIYARDCVNIAVTGRGKLNGNAKAWWEWARQETKEHFNQAAMSVPVESRVFGERQYRIRPSFLSFVNCENVLLEGFTIGSGPNWTIHPIYCRNTTIRGITVQTDGPNNDGIDPDSCRDVLIEDCTFDTGDDCIVLKSGYNQDGWHVGRPTENVIVRRCRCSRGHGGLVIGSEMSGDVRNVFMEDCQFEGTDRVVRIKSRADRGGVVERVFARNIVAKNLQHEVILLTMDYSADRSSLASQSPPVFRQMRFENIRSQGSPRAILMQGMQDSRIREIEFSDLEIDSDKGVAAEHVDAIEFENVRINVQSAPVYELTDASDIVIEGGLSNTALSPFMILNGKRSNGVVIRSDIAAKNQLAVTYGQGASAEAVEMKRFGAGAP